MKNFMAYKSLSQKKVFEGDTLSPELEMKLGTVVKALLKGWDEDDFEEAIENYEDDLADECGPVPFRSPEDFENKWANHAFTFYALQASEDLRWRIDVWQNDEGEELFSAYAGEEGIVLLKGEAFAANGQGSFRLTQPNENKEILEDVLACLFREMGPGDTIESLLSNEDWRAANKDFYPALIGAL